MKLKPILEVCYAILQGNRVGLFYSSLNSYVMLLVQNVTPSNRQTDALSVTQESLTMA